MEQGKAMVQSILVVKIGAIGDVVMSLPMLSFLREKYPTATITWVCGKTVAPLIEATSLVDELISIDEQQLYKGWALIKLWRALFLRSFDLVITAHADPRYRLISLFCRKKVHRTFNRREKRPFPLPGRYHLHEYIRLACPDEGTIAPPFPKIHLPELRFEPVPPLVLIAPGGAQNILAEHPLRRWPIQYYAEVVKKLSLHPLNIYITGASSDHWVEPYFTEGRSLVGKLSLLEFVALLKQAALLITHDSGPLHLAKLVDCPTIALFGPTNPYEFHSRSEKIHFFWEGGKLPCAPCYDGKGYAKCSQNICLKRIRPETVVKKALELLECMPTVNR